MSGLPRFDGARLRRRRLELGIAEDAFARSLGVTPTTLRHLEAGNSANHDLRFLTRYSAALGLDFIDLFETPTTEVPARDGPAPGAPTDERRTDDARRVGAALVASGGELHVDSLAEALGWSPERTRLALDDLEGRVRACGMRLVWRGGTRVLLAPEDGEAPAVARHSRRQLETFGLNRAEAITIVRLLHGARSHTGQNPLTERRLGVAGVVRNDRSGRPGRRDLPRVNIALSDQTRYDLYLTDTPPAG